MCHGYVSAFYDIVLIYPGDYGVYSFFWNDTFYYMRFRYTGHWSWYLKNSNNDRINQHASNQSIIKMGITRATTNPDLLDPMIPISTYLMSDICKNRSFKLPRHLIQPSK